MREKEELRNKAKELRQSLDIQAISNKIVQNIRELEIYQNAEHVMIFYPLKHEINLLSLLDDNKHFYLPKVHGKNLIVCPYKQGDKLLLSDFNTKEPMTSPVNPEILDIVFIPALMVDNDFNRLGYGGGFYDRFLTKNITNMTKIVTIPEKLKIPKLPSEVFDAKIDIIIDEKNVNFLTQN